MKNKGTSKGCTPQELEIILRAKRERKQISFDSGFPKIVEQTGTTEKTPKSPSSTESESALWTSIHVDEIKAGSILTPISDLLNLFSSLDGYLSYYVSALSNTDKRREDCLHMFEPEKLEPHTQLSEPELKEVTARLLDITAERRHVKNRYEVIKSIQNAVLSPDGKKTLAFLSKLMGDVIHLEKNQKSRVYTPKTNEISDVMERAASCQGEVKRSLNDSPANAAKKRRTKSPADAQSGSAKNRRRPNAND